MTFVGKTLMAVSATALLVGMSVSGANAQYRRYDDRYYDSGRYNNSYRYDPRRDDDDEYDEPSSRRYGNMRGSTTSQYGERRQDERYPQTTRGGTTDRRDRWRWDD